ncbi:MAG: hypothetical protein AAGG48_06470 [Planctomycetota bacterium]
MHRSLQKGGELVSSNKKTRPQTLQVIRTAGADVDGGLLPFIPPFLRTVQSIANAQALST